MTTHPDSRLPAKMITLVVAVALWFVIRQKSEPFHGGVLFPSSPLPVQSE
jgi:hypothetical protein